MEQQRTLIPADKLKDVLITRTAIKRLTSESVIKEVIDFQFKDVLNALKTKDEVELVSFGKFLRSANKTRKKQKVMERTIAKMERLLLEQPDNVNYKDKKETAETVKQFIDEKLKTL